MKKDDHYDVSSLTEAQFEPASNELVLKNRLRITSPQAMDDAGHVPWKRRWLGLWA